MNQVRPKPSSPPQAVDPREACVLVVEDNLQNFVLVARLLAFLGVQQCQWKASGWQVLEFAESMPRIDLILLDLHIPDEDGYAVLAKLRTDPRLTNTQIVAVTADSGPESMERARLAGFDGFIGKPLDPDAFPEQIRSVLAGKAIWTGR